MGRLTTDPTLGRVEAHFLLCPFCGGRAALLDHRCSSCGALAEAVVWRRLEEWSPELALVTDGTAIRLTA